MDWLVGGVTAHTLPLTRAEVSEVFIYDIAVVPTWQRHGVGRQLIATLRSQAAGARITVVFVPADNEDTHALDFYQALGGVPAPVTIFILATARIDRRSAICLDAANKRLHSTAARRASGHGVAEDWTMTMWLLLLLLYAVPQETVVVPNVIGLTVPTAEAKLADAGLRLAAVTEVHTDKPPRGIVMGQGPYPGKRVVINYEVKLWVSKRPGQ